MNRIYRIVFNRTLGVPQVVSELASAPGGAVVDGVAASPAANLRVRMLVAALGLALGSVALPTWAQSCTTTSGTISTSCNGTTGTNGGAAGYPPSAGGVGSGTGGGSGGGAGINGGRASGGSGTAFGGHGGNASDFSGGGGGGGIYGGGGGGGLEFSGNTAAGGSGGNAALVATGSLTVGAGVLVTGGAGGNGGSYSSTGGGGGGGGGAGVSFALGSSTLTNDGTTIGGAGGIGGNGDAGLGYAAGGGGGGMGLSIGGASNTVSNSGAIMGGAGGAAGAGTDSSKVGGGGGAGVSVTGDSNTITTTGSIAGGNGGTGNAVGAGAVGVGISGNNNTLIVAGSVSGGLNGAGVSRNYAVDIIGSNNTLELDNGYSFTGNVASASGMGNVLALGGTANASFSVANIGSQFTGFSSYLKTGTSTWTLTGVTAAITPWTISAGTLNATNVNALGTSGVTVDAAGTLDLAGTGTFGNTVNNTGIVALTDAALASQTLANGINDNGASCYGVGNCNGDAGTYSFTNQVLAGGALSLNGSATAGSATFGNGVALGSGATGIGNGDNARNSYLTGSVNVTGNTLVGGTLSFNNTANAGNATLNSGVVVSGSGTDNGIGNSDGLGNGNFTVTVTGNTLGGGTLSFNNSANAGNATINNGVTLSGNNDGIGNSISGGNVTVSNNTIRGGTVTFGGSSSAGTATIHNGVSLSNGAGVGGVAGALSDANGNHILGGTVLFTGTSTGNTATIDNGTGGILDISGHTGSVGIGEVSGSAGSVISLGANTLILGGLNTNDVIGGVIQDGGALTKIGIGTLTLTGANTYSGSTTIDSGRLAITNGGSVANTATVVDNGTLNVDGSGSSITATSAAAFLVGSNGTGTLNVSNSATVTSTAELDLGNNAGDTGTLNVTSGATVNALRYLNVGQLGVGTLNVSAGGMVNVSQYLSIGDGAGSTGVVTVTGAGSSIVEAAAQLAVGTHNATGTLTVADGATVSAPDIVIGNDGSTGTLNIGAAAGDAAAAPGTLTSGNGEVRFGSGSGTLVFNHTSTGYTFAPTITGNGTVDALAGTTILTADNTYTGGTTIGGGTLVAGNSSALGTGNVDMAAGTTLAFVADGLDIANSFTLNGDPTVTLSGGQTETLSGTIVDGGSPGTLELSGDGTGTLTLGGANTYSGGTTINAGTLQLGSGGTTGSITGDVIDNGALAFNRSDAVSFAGAISGTGSLNQIGSGSTTLTGTNTYAGGTTINAGTLQIGNGGINGLISGDVVDNGALAFNRSDAVSFAGSISGSGSLTQTGAGLLVLNGSSTYSGGTTVQSGTLEVGDDAHHGASIAGNVSVDSGATLGGHGTIGGNVDVAAGAHLSPGGSIGTLTIAGDATFAQGSVLDYEFGAPGADFQTFGTGDSVTVGGNLELDGAVLNVTDAGGFGPGLYNLFNYGGTLTETNGGIALGNIPAGDTLLIQNLTASKQINLLNTSGLTLNLWNGNGLASASQMGGGNGSWTTASPNWTDATGSVSAAMQPQPGFAIFGGAPGTVTVDSSAGAVSATGLQFASNGYTLTGDTLTLVGSNGAAPVIRVGDGSTAGAGYTATIDNVIAGTDGLTKNDLGTLVLAGANTYSGGTTINGGTLEVANNAALGTDSVTVDNTANQGATLKVDSGITLANPIAVNNGSTLDNAGTISHTGATDIGVNATGGMATVLNHDGGSIAGGVIGLWLHTGGTAINTGSTSSISGINYALVTDGSPSQVINENGASIHSTLTDAVLMIQGGTLTNDSGASISGNVAVRMSQIGTVINQGGASINGTGAGGYGVILHQGGTVTNQGGATIQGGDTGIALAGASTITNAAGSSIVGGNASVSVFGSGAVSLTNAGTLTGNVQLGAADVNNVTLISGGTLAGSLYVGYNTGSMLTLDGTGTQLYSTAVTGTTTFAGTLTKQGIGSWIVDSDLAPTNTVISAGILQIGNGGSTGSLAGNITDNSALVSDLSSAGTLAGAISGTGSLSQNGSGVLTLTGANSYTGGTAINAGTLRGNTSSLQGNITDNATLDFNQGSNGTFAGVVSGTGSLSKDGSGTLILTGANSYRGGTTINGGTLQGDSTSLQGNITDNAALDFNQSSNGTFAGAVSGTGSLSKDGSGTLTLTGANTYRGGTTINAGTLQGDASSLQGNITDNAALDFNQSSNGTFAGAVSGTGSLSKDGSGTLILAGTNSYSGGTTINAGTLQLGNGSTAGAIVGNVIDNGSLAFDRSDAITFAGAVSGSGALVQDGSGTLVLTGANTYSGGTTIGSGTLQIGNGGTAGSIVGNVIDNGALAFDRSDAVTFAGAVSGSGALVQNGSGTLVLTGANTYSGGTTIGSGTLQIGNGSTAGSIVGNVIDNGVLAFDRSNAVTFGSVISGTGALMQKGSGTLTLTGANSYSGGTTISGGTLQLGNGGATGSIVGNVTDNGTLAFDRSDAASFAGVISGAGAVMQNGSGTLTLTGANTYSGGTTINAGTLQGDTTSLQGNITDNAALVLNQNRAGRFAGAITGSGTLTKSGNGLLVMNGHNAFTGNTMVGAGTLEVGDANTPSAFLGGNVQVNANGTLRGHGTIGGNVVNGGTVWPGGSIGTLTVQGNYTQAANSVLNIDATPTGQASLLAVGGKATILGGSAVVLGQAGNWAPSTNYTIVTAAGGVSGQFAAASSSLVFLNPVLSYTANAVNLSLQRNDINFASVAQTPNQRTVATVTNGFGFVSPMYSALTLLDAATARRAFDQLSGVIHASTNTALVDDSRYVRDAINRHLLGQNDGAEGTTDQGVSVWTSAWGHGGRHDDNGDAALLQANGSGLLVGADLAQGSNARLGAVLGHGQNSIQSNSVGSSAHVLGDHVGLYGSTAFGAFVLRGGAAYSWQDVHSSRTVGFGSYSDRLSSEHHAQTAQVYAEGGYQFNVTPGQQLEPIVNLARVRVHSDALQEGGGNAALAVAGNSASVNTATLGLRDTLTLDAASGIHAHASLGYQQAWGDLTPVTTMRFAAGGSSFAISGMPVARHALATDLGIDFKLAKNVSVDASYLGQFASGARDQGARMTLNVSF